MTIAEYIDSIKEHLLFDPVVNEFHVIRERMTATDGYIRVKMSLTEGGTVESAEYVQYSAGGEIELVTYSHHWANADSEMMGRWDNTPHFPDLPNFPNHVHDGISGTVHGSVPMNMIMVLDEIARKFALQKISTTHE